MRQATMCVLISTAFAQMLHLLVAHLLVHLMLDPTNLENGKMQARRRKTVQIIRQSAPTMPWCVHLLLQPCSFAAFVARAQGPGPYRPCARTGTGATEAIMPVCVVVYFSDIPRKYASPSSWPHEHMSVFVTLAVFRRQPSRKTLRGGG